MDEDAVSDLDWCAYLNSTLGTEMTPADVAHVPDLWLGIAETVLTFKAGKNAGN